MVVLKNIRYTPGEIKIGAAPLQHSQILKYYFDISKNEQKRRPQERRTDPLKQGTVSPIDRVTLKRCDLTPRRATRCCRGPQVPQPVGALSRRTISAERGLMSSPICSPGWHVLTDKYVARPEPQIVFYIGATTPESDY